MRLVRKVILVNPLMDVAEHHREGWPENLHMVRFLNLAQACPAGLSAKRLRTGDNWMHSKNPSHLRRQRDRENIHDCGMGRELTYTPSEISNRYLLASVSP